jgi:hypothetical protein
VSDPSRAVPVANLPDLSRYHKAQIDTYIGQELRIRNMHTNTVLDWSGGNNAEGQIHSWQAHSGKHNQMVRIRIHV